MEPTVTQFTDAPKIFRKGDSDLPLASRATEQRIQRESERRDIGDVAQDTRDYNRGITTARYMAEQGNNMPLREYTGSELGPVSGAELKKHTKKLRDDRKKRR